INRNRADYKQIQGNLVEEYLDAFSVAFLPTEVKYEEKDGESIRVLDDCILMNVALTGNPCNTKAQLVEVFTKSMDALEEYKKKKAVDPSVENDLVVKDNKDNPLGFVWGKVYMGKPLDKKELKLLKSALDVTDNKGTESTLAKEYYNKLVNGEKLTNKEYWIFKELVQINYQSEDDLMVESIKSKSPKKSGDNSKLNLPKNSIKMTDDPNDAGTDTDADAGNDAGNDAGDSNQEGEQTKMLKSVSENLKSLSDKYVGLKEENATIKEDMKAISENLAKVVKALEQPIHKSQGDGMTDAQKKAALEAGAEGKSVDPLSLF
ncbi:hypothetical protein KA005_45410, partial [bacterium]|nr:hypothetical protein [bacterium]